MVEEHPLRHDPGGLLADFDHEQNIEVYPREKDRSSNKSGSSMPSDPANRYEGGRPVKDLTRYAPTLRNVIPFRKTQSDVKGCQKIDESGLFSFVTYSWVFEYLWAAFKGRIPTDQTWTCSIFDGANVNMSRMEILWEEELRINPKTPSLFKTVYRFMKTRLWAACAVFFFCLIFGFIGPTCFVRGLISFAEKPPKIGGSINYQLGILLVFSILLVELARVLAYGATWAISYRTGIRVRGALLGLLFKKIINAKHLGDKSPAEIVNFFANDGQRLFDAVTFAPLVIVGPLVLLGGIAYLLIVIGWWSLLGILVFFIFDVIQYGLGMTMVRCRNNAIPKTEKRLSLMGEIIRCIRLIKMNAWEKNFMNRIEAMRKQEANDLRTAGYAQSLAIACGPVVPVVASILTFLGVVLSGNDLLASDAFSAIIVFFVMLFGIRMIPYGSRYMAEAAVALRRITAVLQMESFDNQIPMTRDSNVAVSFKNATFQWKSPNEKSDDAPNENDPVNQSEEVFAISDINLTIKKKELVGICGAVGSGKTALLTSLIGHLHSVSGDLELGGTVAYVSQTPWILNGTVVDNILFGLQMATQRYYKAVSAAQLTKDLETMPAHERTEIGERGATISGGQKARVSLCRALFANRDIYLLDDVLASVDRQVSDKIFENAIREFLHNKTVLMVTTDVKRLAKCDRVVFMENGRVVATGPHEELFQSCIPYQEYCEIASQNGNYSTTMDSIPPPMSLSTDDDVVYVKNPSPTKSKENPESEKCKLVDDEEDFGLASLSFSVYKTYVKAAGSWFTWTILFVAFILNVASTIFSTYWLSEWLKKGHGEHVVETNGTSILVNSNSLANSPDTPYYSTVYGISLAILFFSGLFKAIMFVKVSLNAASKLHNGMFNSVIRGAISFFDSTPTGRILNRFSKDMDEIDVKLPFSIEVFLQNMITCIGFLGMIAWIFPYFLLASAPLFAIFAIFVLCFRAGIRSLKRAENISRSPLFDHITTSIEGLTVIHSYGQTSNYLETLKNRLDTNSGSVFMFQSAMRWLAVWLDLLVVAITFIVAGCIVALTGTVSPADAGMAIAFAIQMSGIFQFAVRTQTEMDAKMTSVERVAYYSENIESEGEWDTPKGTDVPVGWPAKGQVDFMNVKLRYRANLPLALDEVSFSIKPKEKVGIIGRTGSGKSSIVNVLYRMYSVSWGQIFIDGVDIATVGLQTLRRAMTVIPQDPVLFAGTIRSNMDPSGVYTDEQIWDSLERTFMKNRVSMLDKGLESEITSGGDNFSVGERQLFCMARALLMHAKIVVLDEATASLDASTDQLIQKCLKESLVDCTVILIAHRLENIVNCQMVMLLDGGKLIDMNTPDIILQKTIDLKKITGTEGVSEIEQSESEVLIDDSEFKELVAEESLLKLEEKFEESPEEVSEELERTDSQESPAELIEAPEESDGEVVEVPTSESTRDSPSTDNDSDMVVVPKQ